MNCRKQLWLAGCIGFWLLAGCSLDQSTPVSTPTPLTVMVPEPAESASSVSPAVPPVLITDMGPFEDYTTLLADVCFEYLYAHDGEQWVWIESGDLTTFFDQVNDSALCSVGVPSATFDFSDQILVGAIRVTQGCDAAYHLLDAQRDDQAETFTLHMMLEVRSGCPYELIQPLLVAIPRLPPAYTIAVEWDDR